jgi:hypothetical protein
MITISGAFFIMFFGALEAVDIPTPYTLERSLSSHKKPSFTSALRVFSFSHGQFPLWVRPVFQEV